MTCSGTAARDVWRFLAYDLGTAFTDDRHDDQAGRTQQGNVWWRVNSWC